MRISGSRTMTTDDVAIATQKEKQNKKKTNERKRKHYKIKAKVFHASCKGILT